MANYSLVVNSKFQPFSFDRYLQPYQIYGQNYKEIEEQYTDLSTKAGIWDGLANEQTDPYTYRCTRPMQMIWRIKPVSLQVKDLML